MFKTLLRKLRRSPYPLCQTCKNTVAFVGMRGAFTEYLLCNGCYSELVTLIKNRERMVLDKGLYNNMGKRFYHLPIVKG